MVKLRDLDRKQNDEGEFRNDKNDKEFYLHSISRRGIRITGET